MKKYKDEIIAGLIALLVIGLVCIQRNFVANLKKNGVYTACKIVDFKGEKGAMGIIFDLYYKSDTLRLERQQYGDLLDNSQMRDKYFLIRVDPKNLNSNRILLRYELTPSIAKQIDTGVLELGQVLILPGVIIHEDILHYHDGIR